MYYVVSDLDSTCILDSNLGLDPSFSIDITSKLSIGTCFSILKKPGTRVTHKVSLFSFRIHIRTKNLVLIWKRNKVRKPREIFCRGNNSSSFSDLHATRR